MRRLAFSNCNEGDALSGGEFAIPDNGRPVVHTDLGDIESPDVLRFATVTSVGGFKMAFIGQNVAATFEWTEASRTWKTLPQAHGTSGIIYDKQGVLHTVKNEQDAPSTGWIQVADDGHLVETWQQYASPELQLWAYTLTGPFAIGQGKESGVEMVYQGKRYLLEPGDTTVVRAHWDGTTLAVTTRKLRENETVVKWMSVAEATANPIAPPVVEPPVVIPPVVVVPPTGGSVPPVMTWDRAILHRTSSRIPQMRETGSVVQVRVDGRGVHVVYDAMYRWPNYRPKGDGIQDGDPIVFTGFCFREINGQIHGMPYAMDEHNQPGEASEIVPFAQWSPNVLYFAPEMNTPVRLGEWIGFGAVAGARRGETFADQAGQLDERTNIQMVQVGEQRTWDFPASAPEVPAGGGGPNPPSGGGEPGGATDSALTASVAKHEQQIGDILRFIDGAGGIREYMKAHEHDGGGASVDLGPLTERVAALESADKNVAHRGDRVTVTGKLPLVGNVTAHGTIDA